MMQLAFQRVGTGDPASRLFSRFVAMREPGARVFHAELVFSDGWSYSSVMPEGVRAVRMEHGRDWILSPLAMVSAADETDIRAYADGCVGKRYDIAALLTFLGRPQQMSRYLYICSEFCLEALQYRGYFTGPKPHETTPNKLLKIVTAAAAATA